MILQGNDTVMLLHVALAGVAGWSQMPQAQRWHSGWLLARSSAWADDQGPCHSSTGLLRLPHSKEAMF